MKLNTEKIYSTPQQRVDDISKTLINPAFKGFVALIDAGNEEYEVHLIEKRSLLFDRAVAACPFPYPSTDKEWYKEILRRNNIKTEKICEIFGFENVVSMRSSRKYTDGYIQRITVQMFHLFNK